MAPFTSRRERGRAPEGARVPARPGGFVCAALTLAEARGRPPLTEPASDGAPADGAGRDPVSVGSGGTAGGPGVAGVLGVFGVGRLTLGGTLTVGGVGAVTVTPGVLSEGTPTVVPPGSATLTLGVLSGGTPRPGTLGAETPGSDTAREIPLTGS
ncbi:MAG TPA: hypothetical protein VG010_07520, partial [Solirubrobacteraceae bacterium]|nr:hypothetical protein [Solirubrobacteraceae bacterium]